MNREAFAKRSPKSPDSHPSSSFPKRHFESIPVTPLPPHIKTLCTVAFIAYFLIIFILLANYVEPLRNLKKIRDSPAHKQKPNQNADGVGPSGTETPQPDGKEGRKILFAEWLQKKRERKIEQERLEEEKRKNEQDQPNKEEVKPRAREIVRQRYKSKERYNGPKCSGWSFFNQREQKWELWPEYPETSSSISSWTQPDPALPPRSQLEHETSQDSSRANAVIIILSRMEDIKELEISLPLLDQRFNLRYKYPIVLFHEDFSDYDKQRVQSFVNSTIIQYEQIHFCVPNFLNSELIPQKVTGRPVSYRHMIRFFTGPMYTHPALTQYDYYWRIDTNGYILSEVDFDPFLFMRDNNIEYGFNILAEDSKEVTYQLDDVVISYLRAKLATENRIRDPSLISIDQMIEKYPLLELFLSQPLKEKDQQESQKKIENNSEKQADDQPRKLLWQLDDNLQVHHRKIHSVEEQKDPEKQHQNEKTQKDQEEEKKKEEERRRKEEEEKKRQEEALLEDPIDFPTDREYDYNGLHFWNNFELGSFRFFRSKEYFSLYHLIDRSGIIYYHRVGDAPIHTLIVAALLQPDQVHYFNSIGYQHTVGYTCPPDGRVCTPLEGAISNHYPCNSLQSEYWPFQCHWKWNKNHPSVLHPPPEPQAGELPPQSPEPVNQPKI